MRKLIFVMAGFFFVGVIPAQAADIYFTNAAAGGATGANCANAIAKSSVSWAAGNTYHVCGTITSSIAPSADGTVGNQITILFESGAMVSMPACGSTGCITLDGHSYIIVDGGTTCGVVGHAGPANTLTPCNGIIQATANGTGQGNAESYGISCVSGCNHVEIRNLHIRNMYAYNGSNNDDPPGNYYAINLVASNVSIHNNIMHNCMAGPVGNVPTSAVQIYNNEIYNMNWSMFFSGSSTVNGITNIQVYNNDLHDWSLYDNTADSLHHDGVFFAGNDNNADGVSQADIYDNYLHGVMSSASVCTGSSGSCMTAPIFVNDANNIRTYNNLIVIPGNGGYVNNGLIFYWSPGTLQHNDLIANNTVIDLAGTSGAAIYVEGDASMTLQNNIMSGSQNLLWTTSGTTFTALTNNTYRDSSLSWRRDNNYYSSLPAWQTAIGKDSSSRATIGSLGLNSNYVPNSGSIVIGAGMNLTSLGYTALDVDMAGNARRSSGAWDGGAYQSGSSQTSNAPNPPSGLSAAVN